MILETPLDAAWAALSTLTPVRGSVGEFTGTAVLEEADDDTRTATLRLQGSGPLGPRTATVIARLEPAAAATRLHLATRAHPHPPDAASIERITELLATVITRAPAARLVAASVVAAERRRT